MNKNQLKSLLENIYVLLAENAPIMEPEVTQAEPVIQAPPPTEPGKTTQNTAPMNPLQIDQMWRDFWQRYVLDPTIPFPVNPNGREFLRGLQLLRLDQFRALPANIQQALRGATYDIIVQYRDDMHRWEREVDEWIIQGLDPSQLIPPARPMFPDFLWGKHYVPPIMPPNAKPGDALA